MGSPHEFQNRLTKPFDSIGRRKRQRQQKQENRNRILGAKCKSAKQAVVEEHMDKPDVCGMLAKIAQHVSCPLGKRTDAEQYDRYGGRDERHKKRRHDAVCDNHARKCNCCEYIYYERAWQSVAAAAEK